MILASNCPKWPLLGVGWPWEPFFFRITWPRASFWYIICLRSVFVLFWPRMTTYTSHLGVSDLEKHFFRNHVTKSFILQYYLSTLWNFWISTPNDPEYPQVTQNTHLLFVKPLLGHKLQLKLSKALIESFVEPK